MKSEKVQISLESVNYCFISIEVVQRVDNCSPYVIPYYEKMENSSSRYPTFNVIRLVKVLSNSR